MLLPNKLHKDYTQSENGYQLKLPLNIESIIPENDSVRLLSQFVEGMDLTDLYSTYERIPENPSPRTLLKIMLYAYMNRDFSSRSIESRCRRDINFMYLLEGAPAPDHATFARFRSLHFGCVQKKFLRNPAAAFTSWAKFQGMPFLLTGRKLKQMQTNIPSSGRKL